MPQIPPRHRGDRTTAPLGAAGSYVGPWVDASAFRRVTAMAFSDQSMTLRVDHSEDGVNNDHGPAAAPAISAVIGDTPCFGRFVRLVVVNGATPQGVLRAALYLVP